MPNLCYNKCFDVLTILVINLKSLRTTENRCKVDLNVTNDTFGRNAFKYRAALVLNRLPTSIKTQECYEIFKIKLSENKDIFYNISFR